MTKRVVVTGWGCLSAVGHTVNETWEAVKTGRTGIEKISAWDTTDWEYAYGAAIKNLEPRAIIDRKLLKLLSHHDIVGLAAAYQAVEQSGLISFRNSLADAAEFNERTGVYVASPGTKFHQQYDYFPLLTQSEGCMQTFGTDLNNVVHPMWLLRTLPNNVLAYTGIQYHFKGANQNIINHSVGGIQAIIEAKNAIDYGTIDRAVVVGYDTMVDPQTQLYYAALGVVSKNCLKPFDEERDGTILAEGSGALMLETLESALARGATIYGEILTGSTSTEAQGIFGIREDGEGLFDVITQTLQSAKLSTNEIGMITAHANGTVLSDAIEANVYSTLFSEHYLPITGFKWSLGHTFVAAGVIETILTLCALQEKRAPGIPTLAQPAKECSHIQISPAVQTLQKNTALIINRGFASVSACLAVAGYEK